MSGTPAFLPPEAFEGGTPTPEWDAYALGVLLFRISTGAYPYPASTLRELRSQHDTPPRSLRDVRKDLPFALTSVVDRMLAPRPADRFLSLRDIAGALHDCLQQVRRQSAMVSITEESANDAVHNLPEPKLEFIGRTSELARVTDELGSYRCLTLSGSGGCGKTRLGLEVARRLLPDFPDGIWFVDLARIPDSRRVAYFVAETLHIELRGNESPLFRIADRLGSRRSLLLLDNCEHVLEGVRDLLHVLFSRETAVRVLATSREALGLPFEHVHPVPSLEYPSDANVSIDRVLDYEAIDLLVDRIREVDSRFRVTPDTLEPLVRIARRLDGIPLALELAAARARVLAVHEIADRLDDRFRLLSSGRGIARHRTLRALLDWSYAQLEPRERALFERVSVFAGGWTTKAMEAVCVDVELDPSLHDAGLLDGAALLDAAEGLTEKSLLVRTAEGARARLSMLESVREYAHDRLIEGGNAVRFRRRHANFYLDRAKTLSTGLGTTEQPETLRQISEDHDNFWQAIGCYRDAGLIEQATELANAMAYFWWTRSHWVQASELFASLIEDWRGEPAAPLVRAQIWSTKYLEIRGKLEEALALLDRTLELARLLGQVDMLWSIECHRGQIATTQGDFGTARRALQEGLGLAREQGNQRGVSVCLSCLGNVDHWEGDLEQARRRFEESAEIARKLGDRGAQCYSVLRSSEVLRLLQDLDAAEHAAREGLRLATDLDDRASTGTARLCLGDIACERSDFAAARPHFAAACEVFDELELHTSRLHLQSRLARTEHRLGAPSRAHEHLVRLLDLLDQVGNRRHQFDVAMLCSEIAVDRGRLDAASRFLGTADALFERGDVSLTERERLRLDELAQALRNRLGADRFDALRVQGRLSAPVRHARLAELGLLTEPPSST